MTNPLTVSVRYLYFLSFIEGASVMSTELIGAKLLAPYFGTSLYVWAAALGLTLGGLMSGYFIGGITSRRFPGNLNVLYYTLVGAGAFLFVMPFTSKWIMSLTLSMSLQTGAMLSLLVFMTPPLLLMGMVSPLIINLLTKEAEAAGNSAGNVYAISTLGGILATFLLGFYIIPEFGITRPAMINGLLLAAFPLASLLRRRQWAAGAIALLLIAGFVFQWHAQGQDKPGRHYFSEGVLGQVKVIDFNFTDGTGSDRTAKALVVNNTLQTIFDLNDPEYDYWPYTRYIPELAAMLSTSPDVLLLGMGGGTVVQRLAEQGFDPVAVEIDERISEAAIQHFGLSPDHEIVVDDARHYLKVDPRTYGVIIYDTFKGESAPEHLITLEGLADARKRLAPGGLLFINFYGYLEGPLGRITRSVAKTLAAAGFEAKVLATPAPADTRNVLFVASDKLPEEDLRIAAAGLGLRTLEVDLSDAVMLTDEKPQMQLYAKAAAQWRRLYNAYYTRQFSQY